MAPVLAVHDGKFLSDGGSLALIFNECSENKKPMRQVSRKRLDDAVMSLGLAVCFNKIVWMDLKTSNDLETWPSK